jgi:hypothetical protein
VQDLRDGHGHDRPARRREDRAELVDAGAVRARAAPDVGGAADLQDVAAVERPRQRDAVHGEAQALDRRRDRRKFAAARRGARRRQHGAVAEHDDGVLDEDAVGMLVGRLDLDHVPAAPGEGVDVAAPLRQRELGIDRRAIDVRQLAGGEPGGGAADQDAGAHAVQTRCADLSGPLRDRRRGCKSRRPHAAFRTSR